MSHSACARGERFLCTSGRVSKWERSIIARYLHTVYLLLYLFCTKKAFFFSSSLKYRKEECVGIHLFIGSIKMICSLLAFLAFWLILLWSDLKCLPSSSQIARVWKCLEEGEKWLIIFSNPFLILLASPSWPYVLLGQEKGASCSDHKKTVVICFKYVLSSRAILLGRF